MTAGDRTWRIFVNSARYDGDDVVLSRSEGFTTQEVVRVPKEVYEKNLGSSLPCTVIVRRGEVVP